MDALTSQVVRRAAKRFTLGLLLMLTPLALACSHSWKPIGPVTPAGDAKAAERQCRAQVVNQATASPPPLVRTSMPRCMAAYGWERTQ